ncbi:MAG: hypothetical protein CML17_02205 [Pusillimonas sp.]|nr:hypothetical protein [Pusillimonas sp.]
MEIKNKAVSIGTIELIIDRVDGSTERHGINNLYTDGGLGLLAALEAGEAPNTISHMALGEGTTAADGADETLESEIAGSRVAVTKSGTGASRTYTAVFGPGVGTGAVTEAGLFNAAAAGVLSNRVVFSVKNKEAGETFTMNWTLTHGRG